MKSDAILFTEEELQKRVKSYLIELYGPSSESEDKDRWMERFGLLCSFINELFEPSKQDS